MIYRLLVATFVVSQFISIAQAEDYRTAPLTHDPVVEGCVTQLNTSVARMHDRLQELDSIQLEAESLIQRDLNLKDFVGKLKVSISGLERTKVLAMKASTDTLGDFGRMVVSKELTPVRDTALQLLENILSNWDNELCFVYPSFNTGEVRILMERLKRGNCLTTSMAVSYQVELEKLLEKLLLNLAEVETAQAINAQKLHLNANACKRSKIDVRSSLIEIKDACNHFDKYIGDN